MSRRKVHFSVPLHQIEYLDQQWETASRLARDGSSWLRMGIDRQRFRDRIERTAEVLNRILDTEFRKQIFRERFKNYHITDSYKSVKKTSGETSQSTIVADQRQNCQLVNKNKPGEHGDSPDSRREQKRQQQQPQPQIEVKYTNRKSTKKKNKHRKKRGRGRVGKRKRKN